MHVKVIPRENTKGTVKEHKTTNVIQGRHGIIQNGPLFYREGKKRKKRKLKYAGQIEGK